MSETLKLTNRIRQVEKEMHEEIERLNEEMRTVRESLEKELMATKHRMEDNEIRFGIIMSEKQHYLTKIEIANQSLMN